MQEKIDLNKAKRGLLIALLIGVLAIGLIIALTFNKRTIEALIAINVTYLALSTAAILMSWIFSSLPFLILTRVVKKPINFISAVYVYLGGSFFGFITPFGSALIPTQIFVLTRDGLTPGQATAVASSRATISSWLFAALGLTIFMSFRSTLPGSFSTSVLIAIIVVAVVWSLLTLFFITRPEQAKRMVSRFFKVRIISRYVRQEVLDRVKDRIFSEIDYLSTNLRDLFSPANAPAIFMVFIAEVFAWLALFAVLPLVMLGFGISSNLGQIFLRLLILFSLAPASPTPGGSGVIEIALAGLLFNLVPASFIGLIVLVWRTLTYYLTIVAGGIVVTRLVTKAALGGRENKKSSNSCHGTRS